MPRALVAGVRELPVVAFDGVGLVRRIPAVDGRRVDAARARGDGDVGDVDPAAAVVGALDEGIVPPVAAAPTVIPLQATEDLCV